MTSHDLSLPVIRALAFVHGLPALLAVLYGGYFVAYDLLDGDTGEWDGLGLALGGVVAVMAAVPLALAIVAVWSRRPAVVRCCGVALGLTVVFYATWSDYLQPVVLLPPALLLLLSLGSIVDAWLRLGGPAAHV